MHIDINALISQYGYLALLLGCLAEGETIALLGGVAAHVGLLHFGGAFLAVAAGGILGDQILYYLGYHFGYRLQQRFSQHQDKWQKANQLIQRHPRLFVIGVRFMYGFRIIGPIIIGASHLRPAKFIILNIIGAIIWALIFVSLGYFAGEIIIPLLHKLDHQMKYLIGLAIVLVIIWLIYKVIRFRKNTRSNKH